MYRIEFKIHNRVHQALYKLMKKRGAYYNRSKKVFQYDFSSFSDDGYKMMYRHKNCFTRIIMVDQREQAKPKEEMDALDEPNHLVIWPKQEVCKKPSELHAYQKRFLDFIEDHHN